jgi:hypothetical protein
MVFAGLARAFATQRVVNSSRSNSSQTSETERGMMRVPSPKMIVLSGEILNFRRQRPEEFPESPGGDGFHS